MSELGIILAVVAVVFGIDDKGRADSSSGYAAIVCIAIAIVFGIMGAVPR